MMDKNIIDGTPSSSGEQGMKVDSHYGDQITPRVLSLMEKISFWLLMATCFLLPIFIYNPFPGFSMDFGKKAILFSGAIISLMFWLLARFEDGKLSIPGGMFAKSSTLLLFSFILSSFLSPGIGKNFYNSLFGMGLDTDTLSVFIAVFILMFLSSIYFQNMKRLSYFYTSLFLSFVIVFVAEVVQFYYAGSFMPGSGVTSNMIGKWNDLGIFFGLCVVMSLATIELMHLNFYSRMFIWSVLVLSVFSVAVVNYSAVWVTVGAVSLLVFVYVMFFNIDKTHSGHSKIKILYRPSFVVILLCVIMFFAQTKIGEILAKYSVVNLDVRPSLSATLNIAQNTYREGWRSMLFGSGPNNFSGQWLKFKPNVVNDTIFWNVDFNMGVGKIPSYFVTLGLVGVLAWILFLCTILYYGFRTVLYSNIPRSSRFMVFLSLVSAVYLWLFSFVYVSEVVVFTLTFLATGVLVASLIYVGTIKSFEFSFLKDPRLGFVSVLILVVLVVFGISSGYSIYNKFASNYLFQKSMYSLNSSGDFDAALENIKSAVSYNEQDVYYRTISEINLNKLSKFISNNKMDKDDVSLIRQMITDAYAAANTAIKLDSLNYLNWVALGRVGEAVVPLGVVDGSYGRASDSYKKALELNPKNPTILLDMARLEIASNNIPKAKEYLTSAISLKSNFTAAIYLLSQIEASEGNLVGAIAKAEQAYLFAPDDLGILFQLGFLKFSNRDYEGAIIALERAESINPQYSNAKYFLGLSYSKIGKNSQAIKQFRDISALNPDNQEIKNIINNLLQGKEPFATAISAEINPIKKGKLPIKETE
ncbi:MAG: Tetratricopeptide TPR_2 repeat-containing protein [Parcubacteria group bacterium GW2011_GWF2_38_76]|nr:MAG: Tetratricopeptide TPR_2 repeat-containing protein [Parcubacteria group bacterium GW2011_GWF2_38_76]HBM45584.1 hypothetical protein [Patescibacteria group bacterium]